MKEVKIKSPAKVNLALEVQGKRDDGYHNIETIFQEISLSDYIYLKEAEDFSLSCSNKLVPIGEDNTITKAWELMKDYKKTGPKGLDVYLEKHIPIAAGLAGGSSNAAALIKGVNDLWDLKLTDGQMEDIGKKIGADVAYFIKAGTSYGRGRGDELTPLKPYKDRKLLLVNTGYGVSTSYIYENLHLDEHKPLDFKPLIQAVEEGRDKDIYSLLMNRLESVTMEIKPDIKDIKETMMDLGAKASLMCGSGPTVFGIFEDEVLREKAFIYFKDKFDLVYMSETV